MLNYGVDRYAKFVKQFGDFSVGIDAIKHYDEEVKAGTFQLKPTYKKKILNEVNSND